MKTKYGVDLNTAVSLDKEVESDSSSSSSEEDSEGDVCDKISVFIEY